MPKSKIEIKKNPTHFKIFVSLIEDGRSCLSVSNILNMAQSNIFEQMRYLESVGYLKKVDSWKYDLNKEKIVEEFVLYVFEKTKDIPLKEKINQNKIPKNEFILLFFDESLKFLNENIKYIERVTLEDYFKYFAKLLRTNVSFDIGNDLRLKGKLSEAHKYSNEHIQKAKVLQAKDKEYSDFQFMTMLCSILSDSLDDMVRKVPNRLIDNYIQIFDRHLKNLK